MKTSSFARSLLLIGLTAAACLAAGGCSLLLPASGPEAAPVEATAAPTVEVFKIALAETTPAPSPEPTATPEPQTATATIGAVGDIMVMPSQIAGAYDEASDSYDFMHSFTGVQGMFQSIDLMCGNLEGAIAGAEIGYSDGRTDSEGRIKFNAPDEFAANLKAAGFDCITTGNNHAGDCDAVGVVNTINALQAAGLLQTGTFRTAAERETPLIAEVNGIKIGILATTTVINGSSNMSRTEKNEMFSRMQHFEHIEAEIAASRAAGAEFLVMFAHWDEEYENKPQRATRNYAEQLLAAGIDAVIGSHPHVVQPFDYVTVTRADGSEYTGLVAYSLGNFLSNMTGACAYGLFVQLTVERGSDGAVTLSEAAYMPMLCFSEEVTEEAVEEAVEEAETKPKTKPRTKTIHQLVPALADGTRIAAHLPMDEKELAAAARARDYVVKICGTETVPVMEDACWIN